MSTLQLLVGTYISDPAALSPRPPLMKRMCREWLPSGEHCDLVLGWVICAPENDGKITHGICEGCSARKLEELAEWQHNQAALALAVEYTLDAGGAGPEPRAATQVEQGSMPPDDTVNDNASEAPTRPGVLIS